MNLSESYKSRLVELAGIKPSIKKEKETRLALQSLFGKDTVWRVGKNAYGDQTKYAFGFWIKKLAERYNLVDNAPAGYLNQYDTDIGELLESELKKNGFNVVNIHVGSWVHGWIHRVVTLPEIF